MAQGAHAARAILHDLHRGEDPGPYRPASGFIVNVHGVAVSGVGVVMPQARVDTTVFAGGGMVSTFTDADGATTGAVGWSAAAEIRAMRMDLTARR